MAAKLYPPIIGGVIPAFCGTEAISVPFSMNKAVAPAEVKGFALKIKTVSGNYITTLKTSSSTDYDLTDNLVVEFSTTGLTFNVGQYYKVQLAYIDKQNEVGYYSTVGVIKYTTKPSVYIEGLIFGKINQHNYNYCGVYNQEGYVSINGVTVKKDSSEKMYSSCFYLYNEDGQVIATSGEVLHNTSKDDKSYESHEEWLLSQDLTIDQSYYIKFVVTTTNGMEISSKKYRLMQRRSILPEVTVDLSAKMNKDDGYIKLKISNNVFHYSEIIVDEKAYQKGLFYIKDDFSKDYVLDSSGFNPLETYYVRSSGSQVISGTFLISRASSANGYAWEEYRRFDLQSMVPDKWELIDCTVEQGVTYRYSLQQYNESGIYSDRIISNDVYADFEDAFLYDGEKQLKIRFNPKITSFKGNVLETKVDTIGSQHPFILRNGNVNYKEFPISGLISYQMDDSELFMSKADLGLIEKTLNLTSNNIMAERLFKLRALEWLTDGKPKLFRSPTEGNYIVRLMNTSLSPSDQLGRMLHTFSCTAYEIAKFNTENLEYYKLIDATENLTTQTRWVSVDLMPLKLKSYSKAPGTSYVQLNDKQAYSFSFTDLVPGSLIRVDGMSIQIGATGAYAAANNEKPFHKIEIRVDAMTQGLFTYSYRTKAVNVFGTITEVLIEDCPIRQFIGRNYIGSTENIFSVLEDTKTDVLQCAFMRFYKREAYDAFINCTKVEDFDTKQKYTLYADRDCKVKLSPEDYDPFALYNLRCRRTDYREIPGEGYYVDLENKKFSPEVGYVMDGASGKYIKITSSLYDIQIGGETINIATSEKYELMDTKDIALRVIPGHGVISEISCSKQITTYSFENEKGSTVETARLFYEQSLSNYLRDRAGTSVSTYPLTAHQIDFTGYDENLEKLYQQVNNAYSLFIGALDSAISEYKEANGIE